MGTSRPSSVEHENDALPCPRHPLGGGDDGTERDENGGHGEPGALPAGPKVAGGHDQRNAGGHGYARERAEVVGALEGVVEPFRGHGRGGGGGQGSGQRDEQQEEAV